MVQKTWEGETGWVALLVVSNFSVWKLNVCNPEKQMSNLQWNQNMGDIAFIHSVYVCKEYQAVYEILHNYSVKTIVESECIW